MKYTDYIKAHQDRIERDRQLAAKYNQKPVAVISKQRKRSYDIIEAVIGVAIAGGIIVASILIG